jgi:uncharacterized Ntn-hydrolase superfamily protein
MTFSIVALDPENGDLGIAVASKFLAVGAVVPWARAGVGAIATQSFANTTYGPRGLDLLAQGHSAQQVMDSLTESDPEQAQRQVGIVSAAGNSATFTGTGCNAWAGGASGDTFAAQGNILIGPEVVEAMRSSLLSTSGSLADRLLAALNAGDAVGGDSRGRQSAAILVVRADGGYGGFNDRFVDLRVDDHPHPVPELLRLRDIHKLYFERPAPGDILTLDEALVGEIQAVLRRASEPPGDSSGFYDAETRSALSRLYGRENLEERWLDGAAIDRVALDYLRRAFPE